jgi:hypothetical protein
LKLLEVAKGAKGENEEKGEKGGKGENEEKGARGKVYGIEDKISDMIVDLISNRDSSEVEITYLAVALPQDCVLGRQFTTFFLG